MEIVYLEDIFLLEFLTDMLLFFCVIACHRQRVKKGRLFCATLASVIFSLVSPSSPVVMFFYKFAVLFIISAILIKPTSLKKYMLTAFIVIFISNITAICTYNISNMPIFSKFAERYIHLIVLVVLFFFSLVVRRLVKFIIGKRAETKYVYDLRFCKSGAGEERQAKGYFDSGNRLMTAMGEPVVVIDKSIKEINQCKATDEQIVITTASGKKIKTLYDLGEVIVSLNDKKRQFSHIKAIVSSEKLVGYDVILNCEMTVE